MKYFLYPIHISYLSIDLKVLNMSNHTNNEFIDEFGRDLSLKNYKAACDFIAEMHKKYAGMSWADITYAIEEEEEEEERKKNEMLHKEIAEKRRYLHAVGEYELEEGEILG